MKLWNQCFRWAKLRKLWCRLCHTWSRICTVCGHTVEHVQFLEFWQCFWTTKSHTVEHVQFSEFWQWLCTTQSHTVEHVRFSEFWQCLCTTKSHSVEHVQFSQFWQCLRLVVHILYLVCYPLANEVMKGYSNATVCPSITSLIVTILESTSFNGFWPNLVHT